MTELAVGEAEEDSSEFLAVDSDRTQVRDELVKASAVGAGDLHLFLDSVFAGAVAESKRTRLVYNGS